jgi:hypothetical protein
MVSQEGFPEDVSEPEVPFALLGCGEKTKEGGDSMRGKVAKAIRKVVFGDGSRRNPHTYRVKSSGMVMCVGGRSVYQDLKRGHAEGWVKP